MQTKRSKSRIFFIIVHIAIVFFFLLVTLIPFLDPGIFWYISFLGLLYPYLLSATILCLLISLLAKSKWAILSFIALLVSWQQITAVFAFHPSNKFDTNKDDSALRVLSWNVSSWTMNQHATDAVGRVGLRNLMMDAVKEQNADVLCFQEFFESYAPELYPANIPVLKSMGFNYVFFSPYITTMNGGLAGGICIFSKFPITDTVFYKPKIGCNSEGISIADIQFPNKTVRIINAHLESPRLKKQEYDAVAEVEESKSVFGKIKRAYAKRMEQAEMVRSIVDTSKFPVIVCGDFNDIPNSYAYFKVKGNLQDAFLKRGFGIGRTFQYISPTLRIDYIFCDPKFKIQQFTKPDYKYSDHYPQVADITYQKF